MDSVILFSILYMVLGGFLLFWGVRLITVTAGLIGGIIGFNLAHVLFYNVNWTEWLEFGLSVAIAVLVAMFAARFYKFFIRLSLAYTLGAFIYSALYSLDVSGNAALIYAIIVAIVGFVVIGVFNLVDLLFSFMSAYYGAAALVFGMVLFLNHDLFGKSQHGFVEVLANQHGIWLIVWFILFLLGSSYQFRHSE